jgi:predicted nucleotidyltransferase
MMTSLPESLQKIALDFQNDVESLFGNHIVSVIVYGSAATDEHMPKKSDVNILLVLDEDGIQDLRPAQKKIAGWRKQRAHPLFLTESYIERSLDSFPVEFLNMKSAYRVLKGKDVLESLEFTPGDLRLQCERELKGNLLHLRQRFILTEGKKNELAALIGESVGAFTAIFRALLFLKNGEIPKSKQEVLIRTCKTFGMDEALFARLFSIRRGEDKPSGEELGNLVDAYIRQIRSLSQYVDAMQL